MPSNSHPNIFRQYIEEYLMQIIRKTLSIACLPLLFCIGGAVDAGEIINVNQVGANVQAVASGSLDLYNTLQAGVSSNTSSFVWPNAASLVMAPIGIPTSVDNYQVGLPGQPPLFGDYFGLGGLTPATTSSGLFAFSISSNPIQVLTLTVPAGYLSGEALTASATWDGTTISALGMTPGIYTWTWGTPTNHPDSLTLNIGQAIGQVPEPATLTLLGIGIAGMAGGTWLRRKRRKKGVRTL